VVEWFMAILLTFDAAGPSRRTIMCDWRMPCLAAAEYERVHTPAKSTRAPPGRGGACGVDGVAAFDALNSAIR